MRASSVAVAGPVSGGTTGELSAVLGIACGRPFNRERCYRRRNAATRCGGLEYRATTAQWYADRSLRRPKAAKLARNEALRRYVQDRLSGAVTAPDGVKITGPKVTWKGRRSGRRQHGQWAMAWSPEQIARRLPLDFPADDSMRISHEAIYQALYVQGRGALRRELAAGLAPAVHCACREPGSTGRENPSLPP